MDNPVLKLAQALSLEMEKNSSLEEKNVSLEEELIEARREIRDLKLLLASTNTTAQPTTTPQLTTSTITQRLIRKVRYYLRELVYEEKTVDPTSTNDELDQLWDSTPAALGGYDDDNICWGDPSEAFHVPTIPSPPLTQLPIPTELSDHEEGLV
ncbi:hypothetical protein PGQ11_014532 [Apiospora arundinis]|uniref:Uncharacterized protein n=1 Tax=Apiospora arundinis TaxID=335852 RepID=A0ABR2HT32_9PEZI